MKGRSVQLLCGVSLCVATAANAQIAVFDVSVWRQTVQQYMQMVEQVTQLKAQLEQLKRQYEAMTGTYGIGALVQEATQAAQQMVPGSWQEIVQLQRSGKLKSKLDYYDTLMRAVDPALFGSGRADRAYKISFDNTRAAFAVTDATFDAVDIHRANIEQLMRRIDSTQNVKEATDLNNRLISENGMLQIALTRLSAVQGNLQAAAQNERVQSQAMRTEMFRFDPNYSYKVRRP